MKNISILVPKGDVALSCIEGSFIVFRRANEVLESMGRRPLFNVRLVGINKEPQVYDRLFTVTPEATIADNVPTDLIIVPAVNGDFGKIVAMNEPFFPWITKQYKNGAEVASLCVGTFILAATGLLDGKKCATHWMFGNEFRKMYPNLDLVSEKIITDEHGVYTSGGANSFWNLILYIIEKYAGRDVALMCAKIYEIEIDRNSQSQFIIFSGQKEHQDEAIKKAQEFIEHNFQEKITVDRLSTMFAIGRRSLERRFKKATQNTVSEYIQRVKIEAAKKSFETSRKNINEIMDDVGYSDTKAFRTVFKRTTGLSPIEYRNKYNKEAA